MATPPDVTSTAAGFREVLHRWALAKLDGSNTDHTGPFEVVQVRLSHDYGGSIDSESVDVNIQFRHSGCTAYTWDGHPECTVEWWSPLAGTFDTVAMLNELLATGDTR